MTVVYKYNLRTRSLLGLPCRTTAHTTPVNKQLLFEQLIQSSEVYRSPGIAAGIFSTSFTMANSGFNQFRRQANRL